MGPCNPAVIAASTLLAGTWGLLAAAVPVQAGPVVCTTTLEAPVAAAAPVEMTRCGRVQSVPELVTRRFYSYTAPFERGVNLTHQVTELLGISMGGGDGTRVMGFGFPDQTIVYDGTALQNTTAALLEAQSSALPVRTADISPCFTTSLADTSCGGARLAPRLRSYGLPTTGGTPRMAYGQAPQLESVRGLW